MTVYKIYAYSKQLSFQNPFSPNMEGIVVVHNDIMVVMLSFFFSLIFLFFYLIYKENISNKNSNVSNLINRRLEGHYPSRSFPSFPSGSPRPPKKNWKEKLKEHLSNYKEVYIGAGIVLGLVILYYYYGQGSVPPNAGSELISPNAGSELVSPSVGPIGPESIPSNVGPIGPEANNTATTNNDYNLSNISTTENSENSLLYTISNSNYLSLISKYFLIFGIINKVITYHPLVSNFYGVTSSLNYLPFIISGNIIDFSLLSVNKYYGSCSVIGQFDQIGFMESYLIFVKQLTSFKEVVQQFKLDAELKQFPSFSKNSSLIETTYIDFINYYTLILKNLNKKELDINIFRALYYNYTLGMSPELKDLFHEVNLKINEKLVRYLSEVEEYPEEFKIGMVYNLIIEVLKEYPIIEVIKQTPDKKYLFILVFQILELFHDNLNCYFDFQFNIINYSEDFKAFYSLYIILLNYFKLESCNIIHFYSFLISHNCIEN